MEAPTGAAVQTLRWQTLILHAKEESTGFKRHQVEERGMFSVKVRYPAIVTALSTTCSTCRASAPTRQSIGSWVRVAHPMHPAHQRITANNYASSRSEAVIVGNSMLTDFQIAQVPKNSAGIRCFRCTSDDEYRKRGLQGRKPVLSVAGAHRTSQARFEEGQAYPSDYKGLSICALINSALAAGDDVQQPTREYDHRRAAIDRALAEHFVGWPELYATLRAGGARRRRHP